MKKILYSIETSRYRDIEKRNPMNDITLPRLSLKSVHHPRSRFLSYSVMPILLAGLFILTACEEDQPTDPTDRPPIDTEDTDNDGILNLSDVDDDNDGLIEINNLEDLDNIRYNLAGTSYKTSVSDAGNMNGAPGSGLKGYELVRGLDFADPTSYSNGMVNSAWTTGSGWLPIGDNNTQFTGILEGNGHKIINLMIRRDIFEIGLFGYIGASGQVRNLSLENGVADYTGTGNSDSENYIGILAGLSDGSIIAVHTSGIANGGEGDYDNVGGLVGFNEGTITACYATGMADGGEGDDDSIGGLVGVNNGTITACYATGMADGGDGSDGVGGLVGFNDFGTITACYATGNANGGDGNDEVGGLVGQNFATITACYATGMADGGDGNDNVGGLLGYNDFGTITACYATGNANGGNGDLDRVGGLLGFNDDDGTITTSYGFGTVTGETEGVDRSDDASDATTVTNASALTMANSSTNETNKWPARVWDFGTDSQVPVLKWITGYDSSRTTEAERYPCDVALLPEGRECGEIIRGQER